MIEGTKYIIIGGKGTAVNIAEGIWDAQNNHNAKVEFLGFAFDDEDFGDEINGFPILCKTNSLYEKYKKYKDVKFIFQMNNPLKMPEREALIKSYNIPTEKWGNFIHPSAFISKSVNMGFGNVIFVNCAIHSNVSIGNHCTFLAQTTIGHDTVIKNHVFTATHVCIGSSVNMEKNIFLGQKSAVKNNISIAENSLVGLGANLVKDIKESNKIIVGSPASAKSNIK
ncbi:LbetaH domain-containing protein [Brumimicrobium mesophilum]|uniref:sialic acid O-acetyltransferase n=1 Tax=Brumimicrobium mesophilum TaxID=392717 RepID=UPI000D143492|nr:sialic acid O-acetyltransferase [Brumimicrobium mesophilum]